MVNSRAWLAEAIATYALVFFGPLSVILSFSAFDDVSINGIIFISLAHGAIIGIMVYSFVHISGCHMNPAVTISMLVTKKIDVKNGIAYIISQLIGAIIAAFSLKIVLPDLGAKTHFATQQGPSDLLNNNVMFGLGVEIILTFFLVTIIFMTVIHKKALPSITGI